MTFVSDDLKILLVDYNFTDHDDITVEPNIYTIYGDHPSAHSTYGEIVIRGHNLVSNLGRVNHRVEAYRIPVTINYDGQTTTVQLNALVDSIQTAFDTENKKTIALRTLSDYDYRWNFVYGWLGNTKLGTLDCFVDVTRRWIPK